MKKPSVIIRPQGLCPGDTLAVISPAAPTPEPDTAFGQGVELLERAGFKVKLMPHAKHRHGYLAGTDEERLADLHSAFEDDQIKGILCARGGYGCMRLLPRLDFDLIANNPKVFMGFSDVTVLHLAFYQKLNHVGFYSPMLTSNLVNGEPYSEEELWKLTGHRVDYPYAVPNHDPYTCFHPGSAEGPLTGGNLSLLAALCGTPWQPQTEGHILFIEDWKESFYTLDRQFQQLKLAGVLDGIRGLIFGDMSEISEEDEQWDLPEQLRKLTAGLDVPVGWGLSVGHGQQTGTLPIGVRARFDGESGQLTLLESPVR